MTAERPVSQANLSPEQRLSAIEDALADIAQRNRRVENDKAWETSLTRFILVVSSTYVVLAIVFLAIGVENSLIAAIVPTAGYVLSTFSFPIVKRRWLARREDS